MEEINLNPRYICYAKPFFKYNIYDSQWMDVDSIINIVALSYHWTTKMYTLSTFNVTPLSGLVNNKK